ncbi:hypothetical protein BDV98DRAFT_574245 [Pterulicium gracile]|uniref:Pan3 C-terminal knob domain-containing protein n=1 Tax=Pterulicium gracile TaxID=1884261 RepID=A0A5C3Q641_9AGAR|nr:hypothetical protein BDV98DRAFT_574245 [Pterula gracilis]
MLHKRSEIMHISPAESDLPEEVQGYHTLVPLESTYTGQTESDRDKRKFGSWPSTVYKAVNSTDGHTYVLRKVPNFRLMHPSAFSSIEAWSQVRHPGIASVTEAFTSRAFGESCLFVVYAFHPGAQTLAEAHMMKGASGNGAQSSLVIFTPPRGSDGHSNPPMGNRNLLSNTPSTIPETVLWSYIVQLASAICVAHEAGLALRQIEVSKVLVTGRNRIRVGGCGLVDVLVHDAQQDILAVQQEDFVMLGRLIAALCCNNPNATNVMNFQKSMEHIQRGYSPEVKNLVLWLIKAPHKHVGQLFESIGYWRLTAETDAALHATDSLENELTSELENARFVRLMCKINFICERPGFAQDEHWSESGDRYIIKLFRDYVFHRQDQHGNPLLDMGHVILALNKLDAGVEERVLLVARDEQSCLVVSFKDVKRCMETAFQELASGVQAATNYT